MFGKVKEYFRDVNSEVRKVTYPKKDELIGSTWVVIIAVVVMSVYLGVVDLALSKLVRALLG